MLRLLIFKDTETNTELMLPVTPDSFLIDHGIRMETINIHTLGDVNIAGYTTLTTIKIDCMFPAHSYPFVNGNTVFDPYYYVNAIQKWCDNRKLLRFVVSGTPFNIPVKVESISSSEKDGTNDVYAVITLREQRMLNATKVETKTGGSNAGRGGNNGTAGTKTYRVNPGDTLSAICRNTYGNSSLYSKLAKYNGIKNPNLIRVGQIIKLPAKGQL